MRIFKVPILCFFLFVFFANLYGQKRFYVTIKISQEIAIEKLSIEYDNGKKIIKSKELIKNWKLTIEDSFYSKYALIILTYPDTNNSLFNNRIFITEKKASIEILNRKTNSSVQNPLLNIKLKNAIEIEKTYGARKLAAILKYENEDMIKLLRNYGSQVGVNDSISKVFNDKAKHIDDIKLDFIKRNKNLYYSFWVFRTEISLLLNYKSPNTLLDIFNKYFSKSIKYSLEGFQVKNLLLGRLHGRNNWMAPDFTTKDILGNSVSLRKFQGKYLVINFWASWCVPCIYHILQLKGIKDSVDQNKLQIISIYSDKDFAKFKDAIRVYQMDWINVFNDEELINKYGKRSLPGLYLVDPTGKIVCNNYEDGDDLFFMKLRNL